MAAPLTFAIALGETVVFNGTHVTSVTDATPKNITGWTISVTIKRYAKDAIARLTVAASLVNAAAGTYSWSISRAQSMTLGSGTFAVDIWRVDNGSETEMGIGTLTVDVDVLNGV